MSRRDGSTTKVFVGSLPTSVTTDDLRKLFAPYGNIVECDIANRCGFLHLEDQALALKAIEDLNNSSFMGGTISVERGRVKPPRRTREMGMGPAVGAPRGRERGGPYARTDGYARGPPPRNGMAGGYGVGREYEDYERYGDYDRAAVMRSYGTEYEGVGDRRPMYDDRRAYPPPNGYERRPYDDRGGYLDDRSGYEDRRLPPSASAYDSRRPMMADRRPLLDQGGDRTLMSGYDRPSSGNEMYSRRGDPGPKPAAPSQSDPYGSASLGYGSGGASAGSYSSANDGYGGSSGGGYNSSADHYGAGGGYGSAYSDSRSPAGGYGSAGGGYGAGGSYSTSLGGGGYGDVYTSSRAPYDPAYPIPPQRGFASSSGGPGLRSGGDLPPVGGRRF
ncbi:RNA-binding protein 4.1-like isoform X2 [Photinus pyralis]|uniref:RRM domain-containing protein n=2 Tax=Photinus pyralis TaxID=7054 RepID=A0A1Y1KAY6_PHOPY|nr:RNA-binding protein 4.1-like isoform X2 [Photinus pyralis]